MDDMFDEMALAIDLHIAHGLWDPSTAPEYEYEHAFEKWLDAASNSVAALRAQEAAKDTPLGSNMSLMQTHGASDGTRSAVFVHLLDLDSRIGLRVRLDDRNRAIFSVATYESVLQTKMRTIRECFADAVVVAPSVGIRMLKAKGEGRPEVPETFVRLRDMWQAALDGPHDGTCLKNCPMCSRGCADNPDRHDGQQCVVCLLQWHDACEIALALYSDKTTLPNYGHIDLPRVFTTPLPTPAASSSCAPPLGE